MADPSGRPSIWCTAGEGSIPAHILWFGEKLALCSAHTLSKQGRHWFRTHLSSELDNMLMEPDQSLFKKMLQAHHEHARQLFPLTLPSQRAASEELEGACSSLHCLEHCCIQDT